MFRKTVLFLATAAFIGVAFAIYQWRDSEPLLTRDEPAQQQPALLPHASQPAGEENLLRFRDVKVPPGESPRVRVFDNKGNVRIAFQSTRWRPVSDTRFHLTEPSGRLLLPGGQLAYVWADEGEVEVQKAEGNNFNPRQGWLRGHVRIVIDRSKPEWREANPDRLEPEQHPELLVKMWLDDVDFDLDIGRIESQGPIQVQSPDGMLQGRGLQLVWNEATRQIKLLRIPKGERAWLRTAGLMDFGVGGNLQGGSALPAVQGEASGPAAEKPVTAAPERGQSISRAATPAAARRREQLRFRGLEEEEAELRRPREDRIDTYRIEFHGDVVAEQKDVARTVGRIRSTMLQLMCDIGRAERERVEHGPQTRPASERPQARAAATAPSALAVSPESTSRIEVRWTGELLAIPEQTRAPATQPQESKAERFHLLAVGSPVEVFDQDSGYASCRELEYHNDSRRVWLRGTDDQPAVVVAGDARQLLGREVFFDRQLGIARVQGAGRMIDARREKESEVPPCLAALAREMRDQESEPDGADIRWAGSAQVEFGLAAAGSGAKPVKNSDAPGAGALGAAAYLKRAVFEGQVRIRQGQDLIEADRVDARFVQPASSAEVSADRTVAMEVLSAVGKVRMVRSSGPDGSPGLGRRTASSDVVTCDRLEVTMTEDDLGRNVPRVGRAFGNVVARRSEGRTSRVIRAADQLEIHLESRPRPATSEELQRLESALRGCDFGPDSEKWQAAHARLERRRRMVTTRLVATGEISVMVRDSGDSARNVDLTAEKLDCTLEEDEEITRALVTGTQDAPATVDLGDVYAKGVQISLDMTTQSMEIPGQGRLRFMSPQDLAGRPVDRPVPVVIDWTESMRMRGQDNLSTFKGKVHAISGATVVDCRELRVEFQDLPEVSGESVSMPLTQRWILRPLFGQREKDDDLSPTARLARRMRKRASYIRAVGDAVIVSTEYAEVPGAKNPLGSAIARLLPVVAVEQEDAPPALRGPIVSRFRVTGPQIGINLIDEHFGVEGPGNLLIEDRRLPSSKAMSAPLGPTASAAMGSLDATGPSQTVFQWESSMTFLNKRNLAQFDRRVLMKHVSGQRMAFAKELLEGLGDPKRLANIKSRQADLSCDNLLVEFMRDSSRAEVDNSPLSGITQIKTFEAKGQSGQVLLDLDDGHQSIAGSLLSYNDASGELQVVGSSELPPQILIQDEKTGEFTVLRGKPGEPLTWNQRTRTATVHGGTFRGSGR